MAKKKVGFFIAGTAPTVAEATAIGKFNTLAEGLYEVLVLSGKAKAKISATTISAAAADNSFNDSGGGFLDAGFKAGQKVSSRGFAGSSASNIDGGVIESLTATKMIIAGTIGDAILTVAAGDTVVIETLDEDATYGGVPLDLDYVAGTPPAAYYESGALVPTAIDPDDPPRPDNLPSTQAVVSDGDAIDLGSHEVTATVEDGEITGVALPATKAVISSTQEIAITGGTGTSKVTVTIAGGEITAAVLS